MVLTITPMVHGGQRSKWSLSLLAHALGGGIGGTVTAALAIVVAWTLVRMPVSASVWALAILILSFAIDARILRIRVPSPKRQVPERWRQIFKPHLTAFFYGVGLGTGVTTRVYFAITYAVFLVAALVLAVPGALGVGAAYGFARGISPWIAFNGMSLEKLENAIATRHRYGQAARGANVLALGAVTIALLLTTT